MSKSRSINDFVFIDYEFTGDRITEAGIIADGREYHFKIKENANFNNYAETGCLIITEAMLAQTLILFCIGKVVAHYGGHEPELTEILISKHINSMRKDCRFIYGNLQNEVAYKYDLNALPSLTDLNRYMGNKPFKAHNALEDARALKECAIKFKNYSKHYKPIVRKAFYMDKMRRAFDEITKAGYDFVEFAKELQDSLTTEEEIKDVVNCEEVGGEAQQEEALPGA